MSYINGNNIYTSRNVNESKNRPYSKTPIEAISYDEHKEVIQEIEPDCEITSNTRSYNSQQCNQEEKQHNHNHKHCNCTCNCNCNNNNDCDFDCDKDKNNCCKCAVPNYNPSLARPICTYLDYICDEDKTTGTPLFLAIDTATIADYIRVLEFLPICNTGTPCTVDTTSTFTIDSVKATIKDFNFIGPVVATSITVNGKPVLNPVTLPSGISATVDPTSLNKACTDANAGTNSTVYLNAIQSWQILAKFDLCGKVSTGGSTCKFKATFETAYPVTIDSPSTFVAANLCLPEDTSIAIKLNAGFCATGQLLNPTISIPSTGVPPTLSGNLMITPTADMQSIQNTKVCFPAVLPDKKC